MDAFGLNFAYKIIESRLSKRYLYTFFAACLALFWTDCVHPTVGFGQDKDSGKILFKVDVQKTPPPRKEIGPGWHQIATIYAILQYLTVESLEKFDRKIEFLPEDYSLKGLFTKTSQEDLPGKLKRKTDALYERVQEILDMRKRSEKKLRINIYPDKKTLAGAYKELLGRTSHPRAWYVFEINTIFLNVDDINEGMLAHEMAHAVIDNYMTVRAPSATSEILAIYVDTHLFKKTIKVNPLE